MFTLTLLFIAGWIAIVVLESQGHFLNASSKQSQARALHSLGLQPIAISVTPDQRSARR